MTLLKQILFKVLYVLKIIGITIFSGVVLYFILTLLTSFLSTHPPEKTCVSGNTIYLNTNGVHVDFIIPADYIDPEFLNRLDVLPNTQFVAFGWGDRNFYVNTPEWSDLTLPVAFKALFLKSETAMHVTFYPWKAGSWESLHLCDQQLQDLIVYIESTFRKDESGQLIKMEFEGYNNYDVFFEAKGSFSLFNTCNVWVNRGLKTIEVETAVWTPFDFGVLYHIKQ